MNVPAAYELKSLYHCTPLKLLASSENVVW